ncbi:MAG: acyl-CoA dehydrogenase family protein [Rhodobacteraceae bacterium]|nr:acyl-CoA dehydrogenase family protein [Paracoccaceae bacterium]
MNYNISELAAHAVDALDRLVQMARGNLLSELPADRSEFLGALERDQFRVHAFSWFVTYVEALRQMERLASRLEADGEFGHVDRCILAVSFGEYLAQLRGGIMMSQGEFARPSDLGISIDEFDRIAGSAARKLMLHGCSDEARRELAHLLARHHDGGCFGATGLDEEMEMVRDQFRRFVEDRIAPNAHKWHLRNALIPMQVIEELAELGVFGLTVPEEHDGSGMPKAGMCVVSEELSRGSLGVGSLATRCEIACELIRTGGTSDQMDRWLSPIATGRTLPTAVFTEPEAGSDLASLKTRAVASNDHYLVSGRKTWITHASRANLMTMLVRTDPDSSDYRGLSLLLAPKKSGSEEQPFPDAGISGSEIDVLGYRGMKEYELVFDSFRVDRENLLGGEEGRGFRQLMETFESARIQTAARAIGVAQSALDLALRYAKERRQFGKPILEFPRVASKVAMMAVDIAVVRQLTYYAARQKDSGRRCDKEAGMAKLLAARVAWAAADNAVQIHGGNGYAMEYDVSRVLCDARILNLFEGAAEIQAHVIARRLLDRRVN